MLGVNSNSTARRILLTSTTRYIATVSSMDGPEAIGARLRRLRLALGHDKASTFCRFLDITDGAWNHYEHRRRRINLDEAMKVVAKTGVSLDWIYRGLEHTLPLHVAEKLNSVEDDSTQQRAKG